MKPKSTEIRHKDNTSEKLKCTNDTIVNDENENARQLLKESLLMPTTSVGKTTSATICEKTNMWAEHRLSEKKIDLDKTLYKHIVKLNSDRLQVVNELTKIQKSASTGHLDRLAKLQERAHGNIRVVQDKKSRSGQCSPQIHSHIRESDSVKTNKAKSVQNGIVVGKKEKSTKVSITVGSDSSSDESDNKDDCHRDESGTVGHHNRRRGSCDLAFHSDALQLTPSLGYRGFIEDRHRSHMVESVGRRYAKQLSAKALVEK